MCSSDLTGHVAGIGPLAAAGAIIRENAGTIVTMKQAGISYAA